MFLIQQSPEGSSSLPSLCSPNSMSRSEEFAFMSTSLDNTDIDLSMRAPYIPMNENDDLPLLTEDLMWSAFSDEVSLHKDIKNANELQSQHSQSQNFVTDSMEQILMNDVQKTLNTIDGRFVSPNLTTYINTKYIENDNILPNEREIDKKLLKLEQNQEEFIIKNTDCETINITNQNVMIDENSMNNKILLKETMSKHGSKSNTSNTSKTDKTITAIDGNITTYSLQKFENDAYIKNG